MSDLVERLEERGCDLDAGDLTDLSGALEREAAAEIARLRTANRALVEAARPFAERARALEECWWDDDGGVPCEHITVGQWRALARAVEEANG